MTGYGEPVRAMGIITVSAIPIKGRDSRFRPGGKDPHRVIATMTRPFDAGPWKAPS